ncbi:SDR family oxidoreductase [Vibrio sp. WJH972]
MSTVLITGANRGIGFALVQHYLTLGYEVHATYRSEASATELLQLEQSNPSLCCHLLEVTDYEQVSALKTKLPALDLLINNAGYYGPKGVSFGNTDLEEWRQVLEINTIAPLKLVESLYPLLKQGELKRIAFVSSKVGSMTDNSSGGGYLYRSSKAALNSVVKSLSIDLADDGFCVVALHPGWVQTDMGGPNALITASQSVAGLTQVIGNLNQNDNGRFLNYDGTEIPW